MRNNTRSMSWAGICRGGLAACGLALLSALGCGAQVSSLDELRATEVSADPSADPNNQSCSGRSTRCRDGVYEVCDQGRFRTEQSCSSGEICDPILACVAANGCGSGADLIYVVDGEGVLRSFNPRDGKNEFRQLGTPSCGSSFTGVNSMSVDRHAQAWISTKAGQIFQVRLSSLSCSAAPINLAPIGLSSFGMGFVSDGLGSTSEKLFIAGSGSENDKSSGFLVRIDPSPFSVAKVASLPELFVGPELTGTGAGELFGYYPVLSGPTVARIDKATAKHLQQWKLAPLSGTVRAWAFAHWGGQLYIFISTGDVNQVQVFDPKTGRAKVLIENSPHRIVGAGVSTCAPVEIG